ncbi:MAG: DUF4276 family protein [Bacteroidales bacterium]|nr:DUF4276 family protein [Bacteroidales bacterium]MBO4874384.1 DUF4276 family protein [Bacteroidales bacterium]
MAKQVFIGFTTEGTTDARFLEKIVERTFEEVAYECYCDIEPVLRFINVNKTGLSFTDYIIKASRQGFDEMGMMILCVHSDADGPTDKTVMKNKIIPAKNAIDLENDNNLCKIIVPVIPIQMMESWMLADKELLKKEIGTSLTDQKLGINKNPETISDPKFVIEEAIRITRQDIVKRKRKDLQIGDIYLSLGQKVSIDMLQKLQSYQCFQEEVRNAYKQLHLL